MFLLKILLPFLLCKIINCNVTDSEEAKLHFPHLQFLQPGMYNF